MKIALAPLVTLSLIVLGCSKDQGSSAPASDSAAEALRDAQTVYRSRCAVCHGEQGRGDGAAALTLNPKPRDYTDKAWQATVTDEELANVILHGGGAVGKSRMMPSNSDLLDKPEVLRALVGIIRGFAK